MSKKKRKIEQYHLHKEHPEKLQLELYSLKEYRKKSGSKAAAPHSHSYYQIIWFFNSGGNHTLDFETTPIKENSVFFVAKNQIHYFDENLDIDGWLIHFNDSLFTQDDADVYLKYNIFKANEGTFFTIDESTKQALSSHIKLMKGELKDRQKLGYEQMSRLFLKAILITLERQHRTCNNDLKFASNYELKFHEFIELLEDNYVRCKSVSLYAENLNVSSKTLSNITHAIGQKSPSQVIVDRVILEARRLLKFTPLLVNEIGFKLGYDDPSHFVKFFKKHMKITPQNFRDQI